MVKWYMWTYKEAHLHLARLETFNSISRYYGNIGIKLGSQGKESILLWFECVSRLGGEPLDWKLSTIYYPWIYKYIAILASPHYVVLSSWYFSGIVVICFSTIISWVGSTKKQSKGWGSRPWAIAWGNSWCNLPSRCHSYGKQCI